MVAPSLRNRWIMWPAAVLLLLLLFLLLEGASLFLLYRHDRSVGRDMSRFASSHLLTRPFVRPVNPAPGKRFLGNLYFGDAAWGAYYPFDSLLGWRLAPNMAVWQGSETYLYVTDANGFIVTPGSADASRDKPPFTFRVIVLGGSTVEGQGAHTPAQNLVSALQRAAKLARATGPEGEALEFINAGVGGYHSGQEYLYLASDLVRYSPDLVIAYDGWNDSTYNNLLLAQAPAIAAPLRNRNEMETRGRVTDSFSTGGAAVLVLRNARNWITSYASQLAVVDLFNRIFPRKANPVIQLKFDPRSVEFYRQNVTAILDLGRARGIRIAHFLQPLSGVDGRAAPAKSSWELPVRQPFYSAARAMLADLQKQYPSACISDVSGVFAGTREEVYADIGHLLPGGNAIVADRIVNDLIACGALRGRNDAHR